MKDEALKLIERLVNEADLCRNDGANDIAALLDEAAKALAAPVQPEQEPVAWLGFNPRTGAPEFSCDKPAPSVMRDYNMKPLAYTNSTPPAAAQRPWVWLSTADEQEIKDRCTTVACVLRAVKAKLKEKRND